MGQRKYPPLTPEEIVAILIARGFILHHTRGDHRLRRARHVLVLLDEKGNGLEEKAGGEKEKRLFKKSGNNRLCIIRIMHEAWCSSRVNQR